MGDTEAWGTTSGLIDDYDHHVENAWFGYNDKYQDGEVLLLHLEGPAYQDDEEIDPEVLNMYSCGDAWEPAKGGEEATSTKGAIKFSGSSNAGRLVDRVMSLLDEDEFEELKAKGVPTQAKTWRGAVLHIERQEFSYKDRKTGEERTYDVPLPTEVIELGEPEKARGKSASKGKASSKASSKSKPAAKKSTAKKPASKSRKKKDEDSLEDAVIAFASEYDEDDHGTFMDDVFDADKFDRADELSEDEDLADDILDPDGEVWEKAHS